MSTDLDNSERREPPNIQHILKDRARQGLPRHITDAAALDRISLLIATAHDTEKVAIRLLERDKARLPVMDAARRRRIVNVVAANVDANKRFGAS